VKVNPLDPVGLQDRQEEGGEWQHQADEDGEEEEGLRHHGQGIPWRLMLAVVLSFHRPVGNPKRKV
jgi:hypothetical protein